MTSRSSPDARLGDGYNLRRGWHRFDYGIRTIKEEMLTSGCEDVQANGMRSRQFQDDLGKLIKAIREVEAVVATMRAEHDPLASHIFISRRHHRNANETKGGNAAR